MRKSCVSTNVGKSSITHKYGHEEEGAQNSKMRKVDLSGKNRNIFGCAFGVESEVR